MVRRNPKDTPELKCKTLANAMSDLMQIRHLRWLCVQRNPIEIP
jgi:hypothetical protein